MKTLSVIMPRFAQDEETDALTNTCIQSLLDNRDDRFKTIITVVDDGSKYPYKGPDVNFIQHSSNRGIAVAWNTGWRETDYADFFCWINSDCKVYPNWSYPLVVAAEQLQCIAMPYTNGKKARRHGLTGWCFLTTRTVAHKIGWFDESFVPAQYEDTDWFHRAIYYNKIPIVNVPISNVWHENRKGGTQFLERFEWLHMANRFRYAWKHNVNPEGAPPMYRSPLPDVELEDIDAS